MTETLTITKENNNYLDTASEDEFINCPVCGFKTIKINGRCKPCVVCGYNDCAM